VDGSGLSVSKPVYGRNQRAVSAPSGGLSRRAFRPDNLLMGGTAMKASETEARALCEPSNAEQADWPDATRDYVHGLEAAIEALPTREMRVVAEIVTWLRTMSGGAKMPEPLADAIEARWGEHLKETDNG
jgi:hypothetical protein